MSPGKKIFENFRLNILVRIVLIVVVGTGLLWVSINSTLWTLSFWFFLAEILLIISLVRYIEKFKSNLVVFLESINQEDYSVSFPIANSSKNDSRFSFLLGAITKKFQSLRAEKESRSYFQQTVLEQVSVALIGYNSKKEIKLINAAAKKLLDRPYINDLSGIKKVNEDLYDEIVNIDSSGRVLVKFERNGELMQVSLSATELRIDNEYLKVVSLNDIKSELDEKEIESWHKLIRILNHEVMNSMIPLSTLTNVNKTMLQNVHEQFEIASNDEVNLVKGHEQIADVIEGMEIIENRSKGIVDFVKSVKSLTNISKPNFIKISINELLNRVYTLMNPEFEKSKIELVLRLPANDVSTVADLELIEQVLINLLKNALEALKEDTESSIKKVNLGARSADGLTTIFVRDNGPGISAEQIENIFIPFYTTKKEGSGIGLALSRQILRMHKGSLEVKSEEGKGAMFTMKI
jgi:two-component system nitrogen regulation sensor histidine kinase NtrY